MMHIKYCKKTVSINKKGEAIHKIIQLFTIIITTSFLNACGGGGDNNDNADIKTGIFKDSEVKGLKYETATQSGTTNEKGAFKYKIGEEVIFKIGNMEIGKAVGADILYPTHITNNEAMATRVAQILQTLDADNTPDNGINIEGQFKNTNEDDDISTINLSSLITQITTKDIVLTLIESEVAKAHMLETISSDKGRDFESISTQEGLNTRVEVNEYSNYLRLGPQKSESVWLLAKKNGVEVTSLSADINYRGAQLVLELKNKDIIDQFRIGFMDKVESCLPSELECPQHGFKVIKVVNSMQYGKLTKGDADEYYYALDIPGNSKSNYTGSLENNTKVENSHANIAIEFDKTNKRVVTKYNDRVGYFDISGKNFGNLDDTEAKFFINNVTPLAFSNIDNIRVNNQDFDNFSSGVLDTTKWKIGKFAWKHPLQ